MNRSENVDENHTALSMYGGEEEILKQMTPIVIARLEKTPLRSLEQYLGLPSGILSKIKQEKTSLTKKLYLSLKAPLDLVLGDVLQKCDRLDEPEMRQYWERQYLENPIRVIACTGISSRVNPILDKPFDLVEYLQLRAIEEFFMHT